MDMPIVWFVVIGALLVAYAVLDGFDLGVGILHLIVARDGEERALTMGSIVPVWRGNEFWLLAGGAALFAAFPMVYPQVLSAFYVALLLILLSLIVRAVSLAMRVRAASALSRWRWDIAFAASSTLAALLIGIAIGNILEGIPVLPDGTERGGLVGLLRPLSVLTGALALAMFAMQGGAWLALKATGTLRARGRRAGATSAAAFGALWLAVTVVSWGTPHLHDLPLAPASYAIPLLMAIAVLGAVAASARAADGWAFVASSAAIALLGALGGLALFPEVLPSTDPARGIAGQDLASADLTLRVMAVAGLIGIPLVLAYTGYVYVRLRDLRRRS